MSAVAPILPYLVDPVGAALNVGASPGGALRRAVTPTPIPQPQPQAKPKVNMPGAPSFSMPPAAARPPGQPAGPQGPNEPLARQGKEPAGAGAGADVTRGLLANRPRRTLLG